MWLCKAKRLIDDLQRTIKQDVGPKGRISVEVANVEECYGVPLPASPDAGDRKARKTAENRRGPAFRSARHNAIGRGLCYSIRAANHPLKRMDLYHADVIRVVDQAGPPEWVEHWW